MYVHAWQHYTDVTFYDLYAVYSMISFPFFFLCRINYIPATIWEGEKRILIHALTSKGTQWTHFPMEPCRHLKIDTTYDWKHWVKPILRTNTVNMKAAQRARRAKGWLTAGDLGFCISCHPAWPDTDQSHHLGRMAPSVNETWWMRKKTTEKCEAVPCPCSRWRNRLMMGRERACLHV